MFFNLKMKQRYFLIKKLNGFQEHICTLINVKGISSG